MKKIFFGLFITSLVFSGLVYAADDWVQKAPVTKPSARRYHRMAYIGERQVLLFGGGKEGSLKLDVKLDETWIYDLGEDVWAQKSPTTKPSARAAHAMAYIGGDQVLLFGGWDTEGRDDQTWAYDLSESTWTQKSPGTSPSARVDMDMAYLGGDQVLLFGGEDASGRDDETWVYDLSENVWTQQNPPAKPSPRGEYAMAYIGGDRVLLFGGNDGSVDDETWLYDLSENTWSQLSPSVKPSARHSHKMAYMGGDQVLLFGGWDGADDDESWVFDLSDTAWVQDFNTTQPSARWGFGLCETSPVGLSELVLFGGDDYASYDDETWTFGGGDYPMSDAPRVTVVYPNGAEILADSVDIAWTASDPNSGDSALAQIDLDYSDNSGGSWSPIAGGEPNDGAYSWDISGLSDGDNYLVRITATDTSGLSGSDISNAVFAIDNHPDAPQVTVTYPNGGEILTGSATVTWMATDPDPGETNLLSIDLDYSANGGGSWTPIAGGEPNDGSYLWDISGMPSGSDYLVRIAASDTTGLSDSDSSDAVFTIDTFADDWVQKAPSSHPSARRYHRMAYAGGDEALIFGGGGVGGAKLDETWVYDLSANTWTQPGPATKPSARAAHALAHIGGDQVLLFGGDDGSYDDETWIYNLSENAWTLKSPVTRPSARVDVDMAYLGGDQVLLFGGQDASGYDDETWVYDLSENAWILKTPTSKPSPRGEYAMAHMGTDRALLFGGYDGSIRYDQTWIYDLSDNTWTQLSPSTKPSGRLSHAMAYLGEDRVLLFGGYDGSDDDESWIFDLSDTAWVQDLNTTQPSARWGFGLSETSMLAQSYPVLFGGDDAAGYDDETWTFGGGDHLVNNPPQVIVISPNGGEILSDSAMIAWIATDPDPGDSSLLAVDLDASADAGSTWALIDSSQANDGTYLWDLSGMADGERYLVRVTGTDIHGLSGADTSDSVFTIATPGTPAAIADLTAVLQDSFIYLGWTAVTVDTAGIPTTVERYVIYRSTAPVPADSIGHTVETFYLDSTAALKNTSVNHFYVVRAADSEGRVSANSNCVGEFDRSTQNHP